jgi:ATP-dependent exoDNAse (exonuclease V) beta subunit
MPMNKRKELAIMKDLKSSSTRKDRIQIQTIHKAKGLEYPIVFICSLDHGYYQPSYEVEMTSFKSIAQR